MDGSGLSVLGEAFLALSGQDGNNT